jgi:hypothetical protein
MELLIFGLEAAVVNRAGQTLRGLEFAFHERLVDDHLRRDISKFTPLPRLHLFPHGFEIALHPAHSNRNAVDQRKRLRVLGEHWHERATNGQGDAWRADLRF